MSTASKWRLTQRHIDTLNALCTYGCNKAAGRAIGISHKTVEVNLCAIKANNGLKINRIQMLLEWDRLMRTQIERGAA